MWSVAFPLLLALAVAATIIGLYTVNVTRKVEEINLNRPKEKVCFAGLGCFENEDPWWTPTRPISLPHNPEKCRTSVHFYSRRNVNTPYALKTYPNVEIGTIPFDGESTTVLVVRGYQRNDSMNWMKQFKDVYLDNLDANVLLVDWDVGYLKDYWQSVSNTRLVARVLSRLLKVLIQTRHLLPESVHLVGHGLGAHICSYIAKEIPGIGRLTALDPTQLGFEGNDSRIRLDKSDAAFVEVVHTDTKPLIPTLGLGMIAPLGHIDFYFNTLLDQPGCYLPEDIPKINRLEDLANLPAELGNWKLLCSHERAHEYLIEAYNMSNNCVFWGHKASLEKSAPKRGNRLGLGMFNVLKIQTDICTTLTCIPFGIDTIGTSLTGIYLVTTNSKKPYCVLEPGLVPESPKTRKV